MWREKKGKRAQMVSKKENVNPKAKNNEDFPRKEKSPPRKDAFVLPRWLGLEFENYESKFKSRDAKVEDPRRTFKNDESLKKRNLTRL